MNQYDQLYNKFSKELETFKNTSSNVFDTSSINYSYSKYYILIIVFIILFIINKTKS